MADRLLCFIVVEEQVVETDESSKHGDELIKSSSKLCRRGNNASVLIFAAVSFQIHAVPGKLQTGSRFEAAAADYPSKPEATGRQMIWA
jgi:hypothetical protein